MTQGRRPDPRPRFGTPMPRTSITAPLEDLIFLMLYGDSTNASAGVRGIIVRLLQLDDSAAALMRQAQWMAGRAESRMAEQGEPITQQTKYRFVTDNYMSLLADWEESQSAQ